MTGPNPIVAGLTCRCPSCGRGPLFEGFLKVRARCEACGFDLAKADTGDGPAVFVILIGGAIAVFAALFAEIAWRPPIWLHLLLWLPLAALICLVLLRPFKGVLVALQFRNRAGQDGDW